jgi:hypothetical protein
MVLALAKIPDAGMLVHVPDACPCWLSLTVRTCSVYNYTCTTDPSAT